MVQGPLDTGDEDLVEPKLCTGEALRCSELHYLTWGSNILDAIQDTIQDTVQDTVQDTGRDVAKSWDY